MMVFSKPLSRSKELYFWRILIIDDDEDDYVLVRQMLSEAREGKFTLEWASSFEAGKRILEADRGFDAVIVDYDMGCHTGTELIKEAVSREYPAPLLLLTGRGTYEIDLEAMEAGAADYLSKGEINAIFLERVIRYAIERKKNELALRDGETQLRESKERYQELFSCMLNGFALHEMVYDANGQPIDYRFLEVNPAFEQLTGLRGAEILGKTVREILPGIDPVWIETYGNVARTGDPIQFENYATPLGKHYQVYAFCPRKDQFATVFSDISERIRTERELRASEQRFRAIFENRHSVMLLIDPVTAAIVDANEAACSYYGWSREEITAMKIGDINPLTPPQIRHTIDQIHSTSTSLRFHFQHRLASGELRDVEVRSGPVQIGGKELLFSIIYDITEHVKTQKELRENEARLRDVNERLNIALQAADLGIWSVGLDDSHFFADDVAKRMHGFTSEEGLADRNFANRYMHPEDRAQNEAVFQNAVKTGVFNTRYRVILPSGEVRWIFSFGGFDAERSNLHGVVMDITERKQAEDALRESEQMFATAFQSSPMGIAITRMSDGTYLKVNDSLCQMIGYSQEELVGMTTESLSIYQTAEERKQFMRLLMEKGGLHNFEKTIKNRYGVPVTALVSIDRIEIGKEACLLVSLIDITKRKRAEEELRKREAALRQSAASEQARANELETLMDAVPAMIWISRDQEAKQVIGNRFGNEFLRMRQGSNISESAPEEALQEQPYRSYRNGQEVPPDELPLQVASATGVPARDYEFDMVFKDGATYHLIGNVNPLFNEDGIPSGAIGAFTDVTQLRRLEAEKIEAKAQIEVQHRLMEQREQERQAIARDIHDGPIQTLSSTTFHLQMIKEVFTDPALLPELNQIGMSIKNSIQELRAVLNELRPPTLMHFGLSRVIRMYIEDMRELHPEMEFELDVMDDAKILSDQACLSLFRIFQAGINNTLKHSGASKIWVTYKLDHDTFSLAMRDNGVGFTTPRNFDQLTREGHFGLVGMKERAESIGGEFSVIAEPGKGTLILVRGPLLGRNLK